MLPREPGSGPPMYVTGTSVPCGTAPTMLIGSLELRLLTADPRCSLATLGAGTGLGVRPGPELDWWVGLAGGYSRLLAAG